MWNSEFHKPMQIQYLSVGILTQSSSGILLLLLSH